MTIDLTWATAESIATSLDHARTDLDGTAGSAPAGVDAGEATAMVEALLARVSESAAGLSEGLAAASGKVRMSATSFLDVDLGVQQGFLTGEP
ncbi:MULTISPECIES: hypothetical protein [unclassified Nocardioides]|uniref:hypothetical protein n=1 Tax=Nocardioides sp. URHA0032 TaxID=1380388 RepID=UPI000562B787|nr:hypothetical protein [Nocardioides sp. URHA0032]